MGTAALIGAGISAIGGAVSNRRNRKSQEKQNQREIEYADMAYNRSRQDALADRDFENKYNSPEQQMQRLKEAGLNPHLVYGSGGSAAQSASVRSATQMQPTMKAPQFNADFADKGAAGIMAAVDIKAKEAGIRNTEQMTLNAQSDNILKQLGVISKHLENSMGIIDLKYKEEMTKGLVKQLTLNNERMEELNTSDFFRSSEEGMKSRYEIGKDLNIQRGRKDLEIKEQIHRNLKREEDIKKLDLFLKKNGLDSSDPLYIKSIIKFSMFGLLPEDDETPYEYISK